MQSKEIPSDEAKRMCRMCELKYNYDDMCRMVRLEKQNQRAENGECRDAKISGGKEGAWGSGRADEWITIHGIMRRVEDGQWIFIGKHPLDP